MLTVSGMIAPQGYGSGGGVGRMGGGSDEGRVIM